MASNPAGYQVIYDAGAPSIITGKAREAVSGGNLVASSGGAVSSGANSFVADTDLLFATASGLNFTGVVLANAGSNELCSVATRGAFLLTCSATVSAGQVAVCNGAHAIKGATTAGHVCGRSLTVAGSEGYALFEVGRS